MSFTSLLSPKVKVFFAVSLSLWTSVFFPLSGKQQPRFSQGQPKGYFQVKELGRTTEAVVPMNDRWGKLNANMRQYVPLRTSMGQHCSLSAVQRKTAFVEQSWWPELNLFGSMRWCSFPLHKLLPRLAQKNRCTVWILIHECASMFSAEGNLMQVRLGKLSHRSMPLWTSVFFWWLRKQQPRFAQGQPKGNFQMKELDRTTEAIVRMNERWRKLNANMHQCVPLRASMGQHCSLSAVQRKKGPLWNSHDGPSLTCLDRCRGVRSPGIYSSQGRRKRIVWPVP